MFAVHTAIFPFDGKRSRIGDFIQPPDDLFEVYGAPAQGTEIPVAIRVAEAGMPAEHAGAFGCFGPVYIFHVDVVNPVAERADEVYIIHTLVAEMTRIVIESERLAATDRVYCPLGRRDIECYFGGVYFQAEFHIYLIEYIENRIPAVGEVLKARIDRGGIHRREGIQEVPD